MSSKSRSFFGSIFKGKEYPYIVSFLKYYTLNELLEFTVILDEEKKNPAFVIGPITNIHEKIQDNSHYLINTLEHKIFSKNIKAYGDKEKVRKYIANKLGIEIPNKRNTDEINRDIAELERTIESGKTTTHSISRSKAYGGKRKTKHNKSRKHNKTRKSYKK